MGQNLVIQDRAFRAIAKVPPTVERGDGKGAGRVASDTEKRFVRIDLKEGERELDLQAAEKSAAETRAPLSLEDAVELDLR